MAVNVSRSLNGSLHNGMSEGTIRRVRPDTEVISGQSNVDQRARLHPWMYDYITQEIPQGQRPLADGTTC